MTDETTAAALAILRELVTACEPIAPGHVKDAYWDAFFRAVVRAENFINDQE